MKKIRRNPFDDRWIVEFEGITGESYMMYETKADAISAFAAIDDDEMWSACEANVIDFVKEFRAGFSVETYHLQPSIYSGRLSQRVNASDWHNLLRRIIDNHDPREVRWCEEIGLLP